MYRPTIVTGVGGGAGWQALAWALDEAAATEGRLAICHVCPADSPLVTGSGAVPVGLLELVDPPLARAVAAARSRLGGDRVTLSVHSGRVDRVLVDASTHADLMVIAAGGRTTHRVATHAHCPVVVVRPGAPPRPTAFPEANHARHAPFAGHVVVGVDGSAPSLAALEFGFAYAAAHRRPLAAVHITAEPGAPAALAAEVAPWIDEYPLVAVEQAVYAGRPLPGLMRAAAGAALLVVGDRGRGPIGRAVLGSVADGVLDHATGTVAVAHTRDAPAAVLAHPHRAEVRI
jgi:nucleotide-binding universal stress UspA family protein